MSKILTATRTMHSWHPPLFWFAVSMVLVAIAPAIGYVVDDRILVGAPIWGKPLKFALSFAIYAPTLAWMITLIRRRWLHRIAWWSGTAFAIASLLEMVAIIGQVIRGTRSHFNRETELDSTIFNVMGGLVSSMFTFSLIVAIILMLTPIKDASVKWAVRLGSLISVLGLSTGFLMIQETPEQLADGDAATTMGAHGVGVVDGGPGIPILGWSTEGGDLRISHFIGMHALQAIPLLALVLAALFAYRLTQRTRLQIVLLAALAYAGVFAIVLWQALRGQSIVSPDATTIAVTLALAGTVAIGTLAIVIDARRHLPTTTEPETQEEIRS